MSSTGKASAPTLTMANNINGIQHAVSAYCLQFKDFAGAKLKVITTLAKYLDAENFTAGNPTASNESKSKSGTSNKRHRKMPSRLLLNFQIRLILKA